MISGIAKKETSTEIKFRVGDERLLKVSESASVKVKSLLQRQGRSEGVLRVAVIGGGCSGLQYKLDLQDAPANRDILVESGGIRVVVDPKTAIYVTGSQLEYADKLEDGGFKVNNPNAAARKVFININGTDSSIAPLLPPLKPNHPNQSINVPRTARGKLEPVNFPLFASEYFPILGPKIKTADKAIQPPTE